MNMNMEKTEYLHIGEEEEEPNLQIRETTSCNNKKSQETLYQKKGHHIRLSKDRNVYEFSFHYSGRIRHQAEYLQGNCRANNDLSIRVLAIIDQEQNNHGFHGNGFSQKSELSVQIRTYLE